ncbi:hypothetical protein A6U89_29725 [Agrobacterium sp. B133/95]|nr:hypothetical protein A6U89_29725 [Agrobacterium sp. B133/95]
MSHFFGDSRNAHASRKIVAYILLLFFAERRRSSEDLAFRLRTLEAGLRPLDQQIPLELCDGIKHDVDQFGARKLADNLKVSASRNPTCTQYNGSHGERVIIVQVDVEVGLLAATVSPSAIATEKCVSAPAMTSNLAVTLTLLWRSYLL